MQRRQTYQRWADHVEHIADTLIRQIEKGVAPFQRSWTPARLTMPTNLFSEREYQGMNSVWLSMMAIHGGYEDPRWGTYRQIKEIGGQVRRGERATRVVGVFEIKREDEDPTDNTAEDRRNVRVKIYNVFNAQQADGLPALPRLEPDWDPCERAEQLIKACDVEIYHRGGDRAYYNLTRDRVFVPRRHQFSTKAEYYAVVLHELAHASGHPERMDRDTMVGDKSSPDYAREELRAEIASMMLCTRLGLGHFPQNRVAYVADWVKALRKDPMEIRKATQDAAKMSTYILRGMGRHQVMDLSWKPPDPDRDPKSSPALTPLAPFERFGLNQPILVNAHPDRAHFAARSHDMGLSR